MHSNLAIRYVLHITCLLLVVVIFVGCVVVPIPHLTTSSPNVKGHVIDANSGQPVAHAVVSLKNHQAQDIHHAFTSGDAFPGASVTSGADGAFSIGARYNLHFLWYKNPSWGFHLPEGSYWLGELEVRREGYKTLSITSSNGFSSHDLGELRLIPAASVGKP